MDKHGGVVAGGIDRRQQVRVVANGSAILHGAGTARGRLLNISTGGMLVRLAGVQARRECGGRVEIELHLDRAGAEWLRFVGQVVRVTEHEVAVVFTAVPLELAEVMTDALSSALEGAALAHVLLVDANGDRRTPFAAVLRRAGCRVAEASTPLEAIAHLGHSAIHSWVVAIADTTPTSTADELRRFLAEREEPVEVRLLDHRSPTSALSWFTTAARVAG